MGLESRLAHIDCVTNIDCIIDMMHRRDILLLHRSHDTNILNQSKNVYAIFDITNSRYIEDESASVKLKTLITTVRVYAYATPNPCVCAELKQKSTLNSSVYVPQFPPPIPSIHR